MVIRASVADVLMNALLGAQAGCLCTLDSVRFVSVACLQGMQMLSTAAAANALMWRQDREPRAYGPADGCEMDDVEPGAR